MLHVWESVSEIGTFNVKVPAPAATEIPPLPTYKVLPVLSERVAGFVAVTVSPLATMSPPRVMEERALAEASAVIKTSVVAPGMSVVYE